MVEEEPAGPAIEPTKSRHIGLGQLGALAELSPADRLAVVAEGLPVILASTEELIASSDAISESHPRASAIIQRQGLEEAAKILILLDYARCPLGLSDRAQELVRAFYDHGARALYAEACRWTAYDVEMLRGYVDQSRASHFVEGDYGQWIIPNWETYKREAVMYADLSRVDSGALVWSDPRGWPQPTLGTRFAPPALRLVRALGRLGFYDKRALALFADVWRPHAFTSAEHGSQMAERLMEKTLAGFIHRGLVTERATDDDVRTAYRSWPLPMYAIDVRERQVSLDALRAEQAAQLHREMW